MSERFVSLALIYSVVMVFTWAWAWSDTHKEPPLRPHALKFRIPVVFLCGVLWPLHVVVGASWSLAAWVRKRRVGGRGSTS